MRNFVLISIQLLLFVGTTDAGIMCKSIEADCEGTVSIGCVELSDQEDSDQPPVVSGNDSMSGLTASSKDDTSHHFAMAIIVFHKVAAQVQIAGIAAEALEPHLDPDGLLRPPQTRS